MGTIKRVATAVLIGGAVLASAGSAGAQYNTKYAFRGVYQKVHTFYSDESYWEIVGGYVEQCDGRTTQNTGAFTSYETIDQEPCCGPVLC